MLRRFITTSPNRFLSKSRFGKDSTVESRHVRFLCTTSSNESPLIYSDDFMRDVLNRTRTIAVVGASNTWNRPSYFAMSYLQDKGYKIIPINPKVAASGETILGEKVYASLKDIPEDVRVDMVDVFRGSEAAGGVVDEAIERGASIVWMQLGVRNDEAARRAERAGMSVVMDRCPKIEYSRLNAELGWHGFDSGVISSKRRSLRGGGDEESITIKDDDAKPIFSGFETRAIHAGAQPEPVTGARSTPIFQTTSYVFNDVEHAASLFNLSNFGNIYSRLSNPTTAVLEERISSLERGRGTTCTSSGHSAQLLALFTLMSPGDTLVASNRLYGGSITQFARTYYLYHSCHSAFEREFKLFVTFEWYYCKLETLEHTHTGTITKFGWKCEFVDADDINAVRDALDRNGDTVKALWIESLANPGGVISDIQPLADAAHDNGVPLIVDNTMATPYLCQPINYGADLVVRGVRALFLTYLKDSLVSLTQPITLSLVTNTKLTLRARTQVHSTTKFLSGHGNAMGGAVVDSGKFDWAQNDKFPSLTKPEPAYHNLTFYETFGDLAFTIFGHAVGLRDLGPTMAPMNAFMTISGIETLPIRMDRHVENAEKVAKHLANHDAVEWVSYAGLESSSYFNLAQTYMPKGAGSVFTVGLKGGFDAGVRCVERCELFSHLANIGDTRSLILHPASTTHRQLTNEQREAAGAGDDVLRLSIGLESADDLIADLNYSLSS